MSGAGRTEVTKVLEDHDWFVIDNLPPSLLNKVVELAFAPGSTVTRLALVADVRGRQFFDELVDTIEELRRGEGHVRVLFLEASDDVLVRRFEATRRRHPRQPGRHPRGHPPRTRRCSPSCGGPPTWSSTRPRPTSTSSATAWSRCSAWPTSRRCRSTVAVVRVQARRPARRRHRARRPVPAEPPLGRRAAPVHRAGRAGPRLRVRPGRDGAVRRGAGARCST